MVGWRWKRVPHTTKSGLHISGEYNYVCGEWTIEKRMFSSSNGHFNRVNYRLLRMGHPIGRFDFDRLSEAKECAADWDGET